MAAVAHPTFRLRWPRRVHASVELPPLQPRLQLLRACLMAMCVTSSALLLQLTILSSLQHRAVQQRLFDDFRAQLAAGTAPVGPTDLEGRELATGKPVSYLEIPAIGLRQVVVEGTTAAALFNGPGHRRDTPLPGQQGVSIIMGRRATFGGPFSDIAALEPGAQIRVTTGQGIFDYRVMGVRREGEPVPPPPSDSESRMVLATADGPPYLPEGVLRVDAELDGETQPGPRRLTSARDLPAAEQLLGSDHSSIWMLVLWLQVLISTTLAAVWAWHRWGRAHAWVVFLPPLLLISLYASNGVAALLPNLL